MNFSAGPAQLDLADYWIGAKAEVHSLAGGTGVDHRRRDAVELYGPQFL